MKLFYHHAWPWLAALIFVLLAVWISKATAHDAADWIRSGDYKNAAGELCCGERDCGVKVGGSVQRVSGGYRVNADFKVGAGEASRVYHVVEFVPDQEATPSPDGEVWRCEWGGKRKCFFVGTEGV